MRRALPLLVVPFTLLCVPGHVHASSTGGATAPQVRKAPPAEMGGAAPAELRAERRRRLRLAATRRARRLAARRRARERRARATPAPAPGSEAGHRFPLLGTFSYGSTDSRFGAGRRGHVHQGQDLSAPQGTPIVAPHAGVVKAKAYQAGGAGHYVVLDGADEDRDYVFMHMRTGSVAVTKGQAVRTGQKLGEVGSTGGSSGPHLHFEIWTGGGWYTGGRAVDPLPFLQAWESLTQP